MAGACAINAILLTVCASGIFLFVEYLRDQPALGERAAFVSGMGVVLTEDRWLLETQVLTSRVSVYNEEPFTRSTPAFLEGAEQFIRDRQALDERFAATGAERAKIIDDLYTGAITEIPLDRAGELGAVHLQGPGQGPRAGCCSNFRHRIDAGSNRPDEFYEVTFEFTDGSRLIQRMSGGYWTSARVYPTAIYEVTDKMLAETEPDRRGALRDSLMCAGGAGHQRRCRDGAGEPGHDHLPARGAGDLLPGGQLPAELRPAR